MIEIDGSCGEGGGQILRSSLSLSALTGREMRVTNIRAKRRKPGLMRQHLTCVKAVAEISGGSTCGAEISSQELVFSPGKLRAGDYRFAVGSAGSAVLIAQTVLPLLLHAEAVLLQDAALHGAAEAEGLQKHGVLTQRLHLRVAAGYHIRLGFAYARNLTQTPRSAVHYIQRFRPEGIHYRPRRAGAYSAYKPGGKIFLYIRRPLGAHRAHAGGVKAKAVLAVLLPVALYLYIFPFVYCGKAAAHRGKLVVSGKLKDGVAVLLITVYYVVYAAS